MVEFLQAVLASEGIESNVYWEDPARANLVVRIRGNGTKQPILIMGHTDVVGVQAENWDEEPFGGLRKDGWLYGRGSLDDKDTVAALSTIGMKYRQNMRWRRVAVAYWKMIA